MENGNLFRESVPDKSKRMVIRAPPQALTISQRKQSVLVHCSDGWDRTSQLTVRT